VIDYQNQLSLQPVVLQATTKYVPLNRGQIGDIHKPKKW